MVIALLQPTPETFNLFDDIILMREGRVVYHGPRTDLPAYLTTLGFHVPEGTEACLDVVVVVVFLLWNAIVC